MSIKKFAFLINGQVFMGLSLDSSLSPQHEMWVAGLQSDPTVVDVTDEPNEIKAGWALVNGEWVAP